MKNKELIQKIGTPIYVYEKNKIIDNCNRLKNSIDYENKEVHYAVMCNNNKEILKLIKDLGLSVQINSLYELELVKKLEFDKNKISFTSIGLDNKLLKKLISKDIQINLDSLEEVEKYCKLNPGGNFGIRVKMKENIKLPERHTNSPRNSDVGIERKYFKNVKEMATKNCCKIIGIHGYLASNIMDEKPFFRAASYLKRCAKEFPDLEYLNFGSGYGVANDKKFKFNVIGNYYSKIMEELKEYFGRTIKLKIEPGRIIVATAGKLYASVTNIKNVKDKKQISVDAGFGEFVRPKLYNDYHEIEVLNNESEKEIYDIRGNTVLQDDFLARNVELRKLNENDIIAIKNSGAYGRVMASGFPGKRLPKEILI